MSGTLVKNQISCTILELMASGNLVASFAKLQWIVKIVTTCNYLGSKIEFRNFVG